MGSSLPRLRQVAVVPINRTFQGPQTPGRIQKVDPPEGPVIYTIGVLEYKIGGSTCWILPGVWAAAYPSPLRHAWINYVDMPQLPGMSQDNVEVPRSRGACAACHVNPRTASRTQLSRRIVHVVLRRFSGDSGPSLCNLLRVLEQISTILACHVMEAAETLTAEVTAEFYNSSECLS